MSENNFLIKSVEIDLSDSNWREQLLKEIEKLRETSYKNLTVSFFGREDNRLFEAGINLASFNKIKDKQELPSGTVIDFFDARSSIKRNSFEDDTQNA